MKRNRAVDSSLIGENNKIQPPNILVILLSPVLIPAPLQGVRVEKWRSPAICRPAPLAGESSTQWLGQSSTNASIDGHLLKTEYISSTSFYIYKGRSMLQNSII
jgi:hypothetical protein